MSASGPRLDEALVARGLVGSRSRAARLIREGKVTVDGIAVSKPALRVPDDAVLSVDKGEDFVSRGAYKLLGAFRAFSTLGLPSPQGLDCLDIGASTGGFTDVLLRGGARRVVALDVGHGQLDARIASDSRVIERSGTNIRDVTADDLPFRPSLVVSDVSFISLRYVIPPVVRIGAPGAHVVLLVKPQFEVGRDRLGRHGIVTDPADRQKALDAVIACARAEGLSVRAVAPSPIEGMHGNRETLLYARRL